MKKFLIIAGLLLTGCSETDNKLWAELFDKCLMRAAEARKGVNYTTNDDEDYDEVIRVCSDRTHSMATIWGKK